MIRVKIKRQTKRDKHVQSHSPAQLSTKKYHSFFLIWQLYFLGSTHYPLFGRRSRARLSLNLSLGGAKHLHSRLQPSAVVIIIPITTITHVTSRFKAQI